ncbi:TetR family transcriptional regulator [Mycolicibacterium litorale]|uniref:TetR family transcriptional regulator n=1 Tax=Mycolicibacterium litorale TaxID=758802 RepID=A0AAD1MUW8_9MYCO|nr:TetR family transcriptional regulator [Mycolicibacterium litorale]
MSTRAVAAAAGVQPPVIYRRFGDKDGLLDALTHYLLQEYVKAKIQILDAAADPIDQLRQTWDLHVDFGLQHPDAYVLAYAAPRPPGELGAAAKRETVSLLKGMVAELGNQSKLSMSVDRATRYIFAAGLGTTLSLLQEPPGERDLELSELARENALSVIVHRKSGSRARNTKLPARAVALAEALRGGEALPMTSAERSLLNEWLRRLADQST